MRTLAWILLILQLLLQQLNAIKSTNLFHNRRVFQLGPIREVSNLDDPALFNSLSSLRGGDVDDDDYDDDEEDDDDDDDDFEDDDGIDIYALDDSASLDDDFAEENIVKSISEGWAKTPPLTKSFLSMSIVASLMGFLQSKNDFPPLLSLDWNKVLKRGQIWRPLTAFLNIGPVGIGYLMTAHFVWTYMSTLERLNHDKPYDFWIMIMFGCISLVSAYGCLNMNPRLLGHNLSTFLVYIWSRYHEGMDVNVFELFNLKAELLPWFFLAQTYLLEGEVPINDFIGIVTGHIYHHLKKVGILRAPDALVSWYESNDVAAGIREKYKDISADFVLQ